MRPALLCAAASVLWLAAPAAPQPDPDSIAGLPRWLKGDALP